MLPADTVHLTWSSLNTAYLPVCSPVSVVLVLGFRILYESLLNSVARLFCVFQEHGISFDVLSLFLPVPQTLCNFILFLTLDLFLALSPLAGIYLSAVQVNSNI